jgi:hypothetical protein
MRVTIGRSVLALLALGIIGAAAVSTGLTLPHPAPTTVDGVSADLRILHVEKRGLTLYESEVAVFKNGEAFIGRNKRRLLQYRFRAQIAVTGLSLVEVERARTVLALQLQQSHTGPQRILRPWNSEEWYIAVNRSHGRITGPADQIREVFLGIEKLPAGDQNTQILEDLCLGFCYFSFTW